MVPTFDRPLFPVAFVSFVGRVSNGILIRLLHQTVEQTLQFGVVDSRRQVVDGQTRRGHKRVEIFQLEPFRVLQLRDGVVKVGLYASDSEGDAEEEGEGEGEEIYTNKNLTPPIDILLRESLGSQGSSSNYFIKNN